MDLEKKITELENRLYEVEQNLEYSPQEIDDKIEEKFSSNNDEIAKLISPILDLIDKNGEHTAVLLQAIIDNREAINTIFKHLNEKEKMTIFKLLISLSSFRSLLGIP